MGAPIVTISLRQYQTEDIAAIRGAFSSTRKVLYVLPTGGGKTVVFNYISSNVVRNPKPGGGQRRCMIVVHRQELLHQACINLAALGQPHYPLAPLRRVQAIMEMEARTVGRHCVVPHAPIMVASVQSLLNKVNYVTPDMIIIDEAHHVAAAAWRNVLERHPDARVLGVTATPCRLDGRGLGDTFGAMVQGPSIADLIGQGYLVRPRLFDPPGSVNMSGVKRILGDFDKKEAAKRVGEINIAGDVIAHYRKHLDRKPAIAFCVSVDHAARVAEEFRAGGYRAASIDGKLDDRERRERIAGLGSGEIDVLCSCDIVSEGTDIPVVSGAILLRPTQSLGLYLQQVGRVLRPAPGKTEAIILDHVGNCARHGDPSAPREWQLTVSESAVRQTKAPPPPMRRCPNCYALNSAAADACACCGQALGRLRAASLVVDGSVELVERTGSAPIPIKELTIGVDDLTAGEVEFFNSTKASKMNRARWLPNWHSQEHAITRSIERRILRDIQEIREKNNGVPQW